MIFLSKSIILAESRRAIFYFILASASFIPIQGFCSTEGQTSLRLLRTAENLTSAPVEKRETFALDQFILEPWDASTQEKIAEAIVDFKDWEGVSESLKQWLMQNYNAEAIVKPSWKQISNLQRFCNICAKNKDRISGVDFKIFLKILADQVVLNEFVQNFRVKLDSLPGALKVLNEFFTNEPEAFPKYNRVAIAMALVYDKAQSPLPHGQVSSEAMPKKTDSLVDQFRFWIKSNESKKTQFDLSNLEVEQVKFVIDSVAPISELEWAQETVTLNRYNFDKIYFTIKYDNERIDHNILDWPHPEYTLAEIKKHGGICVDQAYFADTVGKAFGIPTLYFTGGGERGRHAWVGFMRDLNIWSMDCGRYRYDKYATGQAMDPQTHKYLTDHELVYLAESFRKTVEYAISDIHYQQALVFESKSDMDRALLALDQSIHACPRYLEPWEMKTQLLMGNLPNQPEHLARYEKHLEDMLVQFTKFPDIRADCQFKLSDLLLANGDIAGARKIENIIITENLSRRADLTAEVYMHRIYRSSIKNDWNQIVEDFHDSILKLSGDAGPAFKILSNVCSLEVKQTRFEDAEKSIHEFRSHFTIDSLMREDVDQLSRWVHRQKVAAAKQAAKKGL